MALGRVARVLSPRRATPAPPTSAVVAAFPALEDALGGLRRRLDPSTATGMPAHVTVLYPFATGSGQGPAATERLTRSIGSIPAFTVSFRRVGWFDDRVLYLAPEPVDPFLRLTQAITEEFPECAPYEGRFDAVIPHLTIGEDAPVRRLRRAATSIERLLPLEADVQDVWLMETDGRTGWRHADTIGLNRT